MTRVNPGELLVDNMTQHPVSVSGLRCVDGTEVIVGAGQLLFLEEGNQTMAEHTEGPYEVYDTGSCGNVYVVGQAGAVVIASFGNSTPAHRADAERVRVALECHAGLVAAGTTARLRFDSQVGQVSKVVWDDNYAAARALDLVLAKAKGEGGGQ